MVTECKRIVAWEKIGEGNFHSVVDSEESKKANFCVNIFWLLNWSYFFDCKTAFWLASKALGFNLGVKCLYVNPPNV